MNSEIKKTDFLIVGAGIAGTTLALELISRGMSVHVWDNPNPNSSSRIAAGILNPVVPKGVTTTWQIDSIFPRVFDYYRNWERLTGGCFIQSQPFLTLHKSADEQNQWSKRYLHPTMCSWIELAETPGWSLNSTTFGSSNTLHAGRLDVAAFLNSAKEFLLKQGVTWENSTFGNNPSDHQSFFDYLRLNNTLYSSIIFCQGVNGRDNPLFPNLFYDPTGGDILTVRIEELPQQSILKRGLWLVPIGESKWLAGSNFHKGNISEIPKTEDAERLLEQLRSWIPFPIELIDHKRGTRPTVQNRRPYLGQSPLKDFDYCYLFNGLGSKGSSLCCWLAPMMADYLCHGTPLHEDVNILRFYNP